MPDHDERDPLDSWLDQQVRPLPPPPGTFELITRRARRRKLRRAAVTVASAAVVAAGMVVVTTNPALLNLSPPSESGQVAAGARQASASAGPGAHTPNGSGRLIPPTPAPSASVSAAPPHPGPVPPNFAPTSVTFVSPEHGWVIGQAGTPGSCYNGDICTSVAWTSDGGSTWHGEHAPVTGPPSGPSGVSGIRFLEGRSGWAFGPELWATHDGGEHWRRVGTSGRRVTDLETAGDRAYALFANCSGTSAAGFAAHCTSYTLMTTTASSDNWVPAGAATTGMAGGASDTVASPGAGGTSAGGDGAAAMLALTGSRGFLVAPDGSLYSGPLGGTWSKTGAVPCPPGNLAQSSGLPASTLLSPETSSELQLACAGDPPLFYSSSDGGATWTQRQAGDWSAVSGSRGDMTSFAATSTGKLMLATTTGIFYLSSGSSQWRSASIGGSGAVQGGFSYVGMTTPERGVAVPADASAHEIYLTTDGGLTWTPSPIS